MSDIDCACDRGIFVLVADNIDVHSLLMPVCTFTRLIPLVKRHHLLLVTLLLANAGVAETLPLFLDRLVPSPIYAVVISAGENTA